MSRYAFIRARPEPWPVQLLCRLLAVSPAGYYQWHQRPNRPTVVLLAEQPKRRDKTQGVFLLSEPTSPDTLSLNGAIRNDQLDKHGDLTAYTAGHRYTRQSQLERVANLPAG